MFGRPRPIDRRGLGEMQEGFTPQQSQTLSRLFLVGGVAFAASGLTTQNGVARKGAFAGMVSCFVGVARPDWLVFNLAAASLSAGVIIGGHLKQSRQSRRGNPKPPPS